jgi:hypothetical protein
LYDRRGSLIGADLFPPVRLSEAEGDLLYAGFCHCEHCEKQVPRLAFGSKLASRCA